MKKLIITGLTTLTLASTMFAYCKPIFDESGEIYGWNNQGSMIQLFNDTEDMHPFRNHKNLPCFIK